MLIHSIYLKFFEEGSVEYAYGSSREFMEDLYTGLDVLVYIALELKNEFGICMETDNPQLPGECMESVKQLLEMTGEHIRGRMEATMFVAEMPYLRLAEALELSRWQMFCLLLGGACFKSDKYGKMFAELSGNSRAVDASMKLALFLYRITDNLSMPEYLDSLSGKEFNGLFLVAGMPVTLILKPYVSACLYDGYIGEGQLTKGMKLYRYPERPEEMLIYQEQLENLKRLFHNLKPWEQPRVILWGEPGCGRKSLLRNLAYSRHRNVLFLEYHLLMDEETREERIVDSCLKAVLFTADLCICNCQSDKKPEKEEKPPQTTELDDILEQLELSAGNCHIGLFFTGCESLGRIVSAHGKIYEQQLPTPGAQERITLWNCFLAGYGKEEDVDAIRLGNRYCLNAGEIKRVLENANLCAQGKGRNRVSDKDIMQAVKQYNGNLLGAYAELVNAVYTMEDLVADEEVMKQLGHVRDRMVYHNIVSDKWGFKEKAPYGRGICTLFYGPPGTGKTMAAQALANELGLDLYRIDLSRMVSKYIGETQKHISRLFEQAKHISAILFFDEADALFAKRTGVGDSNDRHANSEVAHLLQKLEEYEGISILATNLKENIDDAFKRRIKYMIHFRFPDASARELLWHKVLPDKAPVEEDLALAYFARHFEMSGSEIKETMLHAAFSAAREHSSIGNRHIIEALKINFAKYGKLLTEEDFHFLL